MEVHSFTLPSHYSVYIHLEDAPDWEEEPGYYYQITKGIGTRPEIHTWVAWGGPFPTQEDCKKAAKAYVLEDKSIIKC